MERAKCFLCSLSVWLLVFTSLAHAANDTQQITDILGREVTVAKTINGIILGESRFIPALGIVVEDAAISRIKGMQADLKQYDPATWAVYAKHFPAIDKIPLIGKGEASSFSVEKAISLMPDVALFGISGHGPSPRDQEMLNPLEAAGGRHIGAELIPGDVGNVNIEHLLSQQPDRYLATAIGSANQSSAASPYVLLGPDVSEAQARDSLQRAANAMLVRNLTAVQKGEMFGVWHHFYNSPFNVTALAAMAKWLHPETFADMEPERLLADFYRDFQPVPFQGIYWVEMRPDKSASVAVSRAAP